MQHATITPYFICLRAFLIVTSQVTQPNACKWLDETEAQKLSEEEKWLTLRHLHVMEQLPVCKRQTYTCDTCQTLTHTDTQTLWRMFKRCKDQKWVDRTASLGRGINFRILHRVTYEVNNKQSVQTQIYICMMLDDRHVMWNHCPIFYTTLPHATDASARVCVLDGGNWCLIGMSITARL